MDSFTYSIPMLLALLTFMALAVEAHIYANPPRPKTMARHLNRCMPMPPPAAPSISRIPTCGQTGGDHQGWAKTLYTHVLGEVTCKRCLGTKAFKYYKAKAEVLYGAAALTVEVAA